MAARCAAQRAPGPPDGPGQSPAGTSRSDLGAWPGAGGDRGADSVGFGLKSPVFCQRRRCCGPAADGAPPGWYQRLFPAFWHRFWSATRYGGQRCTRQCAATPPSQAMLETSHGRIRLPQALLNPRSFPLALPSPPVLSYLCAPMLPRQLSTLLLVFSLPH